MPKKHVYAKSEHGIGDFVYVDLLPEVRRPRQFNVNVIISLLFAVVLVWVLIFNPVSTRTAELEDLRSWNNDLLHEKSLIQEEFDGYEIDLEVVEFEDSINNLDSLKVDFNNLLDDVELAVDEVAVDEFDGNITFISYLAESKELKVTVQFIDQNSFSALEDELHNYLKERLINVTPPEEEFIIAVNRYSGTFILEVDPNVE